MFKKIGAYIYGEITYSLEIHKLEETNHLMKIKKRLKSILSLKTFLIENESKTTDGCLPFIFCQK